MRFILGVPFAAIVTLSLFFMMATLIANDDVDLRPQTDPPNLKIVAEEPTEPKQSKKIKTSKLPDPPAAPTRTPSRGPLDGPVVPIPDSPKSTPTPGKGDFVVSPPALKTRPIYPEACRSRGASGRVVVQFEVTPEGNVVNPRIIESPDRCFERSVLKTVSSWKFPPQGNRQKRFTITQSFLFQLN